MKKVRRSVDDMIRHVKDTGIVASTGIDGARDVVMLGAPTYDRIITRLNGQATEELFGGVLPAGFVFGREHEPIILAWFAGYLGDEAARFGLLYNDDEETGDLRMPA